MNITEDDVVTIDQRAGVYISILESVEILKSKQPNSELLWFYSVFEEAEPEPEILEAYLEYFAPDTQNRAEADNAFNEALVEAVCHLEM